MKIDDYFKGAVTYPINTINIQSILVDRGIVLDLSTAVVTDLSVKDLELSKADILMFIVRATNVGSERQSKGDWTSETGGIRITNSDRNFMISEARKIYRKYGEYDNDGGNILNI